MKTTVASKNIPFPDAGTQEDRGERPHGSTEDSRPSWVQHCEKENVDWKHALGHFAATHLMKYGTVAQIGSGTTFTVLMDHIIERQTEQKDPLDLIILTTNLQVMEKGRDAQKEHPELFNTMQIILTGGAFQLSLHSLVGLLLLQR